jgi:hypothetical protein
MRKHVWFTVSVAALLAAGLVLGNAVVVFVNGVRTTDVIVSKGKVYISTDALKQAGAEVTKRPDGWSVQFIPVGGRMQADAVEGVEGEWVSNGTWRIRISNVQEVPNPFGSGPGYAVRLEVRNLGRNPQSMHNTGLDNVQLLDSNNNILSVTDWNEKYNSIPPGGGFAVVLRFGDPRNQLDSLGRPTKVLVLFRNWGGTKLPHFRIALKGQ